MGTDQKQLYRGSFVNCRRAGASKEERVGSAGVAFCSGCWNEFLLQQKI